MPLPVTSPPAFPGRSAAMPVLSEDLTRNGHLSLAPPLAPEEVREEKRETPQKSCDLTLLEKGLGFLFVGVWTFLFVFGTLLGTSPYRAKLASLATLSPKEMLLCVTIVFLFYTLSNVAILCCLSAVMGAIGRKARMGNGDRRAQEQVRDRYVGAAMRG